MRLTDLIDGIAFYAEGVSSPIDVTSRFFFDGLEGEALVTATRKELLHSCSEVKQDGSECGKKSKPVNEVVGVAEHIINDLYANSGPLLPCSQSRVLSHPTSPCMERK